MSDSFKDRERGEEAKYALDQETEFKVMARRNKLLGQWAAELARRRGRGLCQIRYLVRSRRGG